ncbi:MAG: hypothetical protein CSA32_02700 [Desulfobulbus propionicus]|nr:MAG: hypothetical protein CSA32_02700 [Desulfobulbus propionicus]
MSSSRIFRKDASFIPKSLVLKKVSPERATAKETGSNDAPEESRKTEQEEAPQLMSDLKAEEKLPEEDREALREEAYRQGIHDATRQQEKKLAPLLAALTNGCQKIDSLQQALYDTYREAIIDHIIMLSRSIIDQELTTRRDIIAGKVKSAFQQAIDDEEFTLTIHPDDLAEAEQLQEDLLQQIRSLKHIILRTDLAVERGGFLLESKGCLVDATIQTQLESGREFLEEEIESLAPEHDLSDKSTTVVE